MKRVSDGVELTSSLPPCARAICAILGVLKTGAMYVPLDPESPAPRTAPGFTFSRMEDRTSFITDRDKPPKLRELSPLSPKLREQLRAQGHLRVEALIEEGVQARIFGHITAAFARDGCG